jgi:hypothetical protein
VVTVTVTAPPRPPRPNDPVRRDDPEALIEEARQRQRRRRRRYAAAAALVVLTGAALSLVLGRPGPSRSVDAELSPAQAAAVPRDEAATLIAHHWAFHKAYVLIYDDGRAIVALEGHPSRPWFERRLTRAGVELVRSGALPPRSVLQDMLLTDLDAPDIILGAALARISSSSLPAGTWADSQYRSYQPSRYAVCPDGFGLDTALGMLADRGLPAVAALLRGTERTYDNFEVLLDVADRGDPFRCFDLTAEETGALRRAAGEPRAPIGTAWQYLRLAAIGFDVAPSLPHGQPVAFPG